MNHKSSFIISTILELIAQLSLYTLKKLRIDIKEKLTSVKIFLVFGFLVSLPFSVGNHSQLGEISSADINISPSVYGIVYFSTTSISIFLLLMIVAIEYRFYKKVLTIRSFESLFLLFLVWCLLSNLFTIDVPASTIWSLRIIFGMTCYFIFSRMLLGQRIMNIVIYAFVFTAILEIILGWFQFLSGGPLNSLFENTQRFLESNPNPSIFYRFGFFRAIGTFIHPNTLSTYISLILPFLLIQIIHKKTRNNFLFVTAAFLAITAPIVTMTRWGFVSLGVTLLTFAILIKRPLKFKINLNRSQYMKLFGLSILTIAIFITTTQRLQTSTTNDLSLLTRIELTKQAVYTIQNNPLFGVGGGGFIKYFQQNDITNNSISRIFLAPVHSMPLLIASEHGIISLALLLSSLVYLSLYINNQSKKHELSLIKIACITSLIIFALNSLVSMRYFGDRISILFFTILGLTVNILDQNFKKDLN